MNKTRVHFRRFPYPDYMTSCKGEFEILALFPDDKDYPDPTLIESYARIGQHAAASMELINNLEPATELEYAGLKEELESIGYELEILK